MSELKARKFFEVVPTSKAGFYQPGAFVDGYLKAKADKVIEEKDEIIDELKEHIDELQKATDSAWSKVNAIYDELRHQKYKRCVAMAQKVLDACCGSKMFYFSKNDPNVLYVDKRKVENEIIWTSKDGKQVRKIDIMPDVVADFCNLPFAKESFYHVVFDPPHLINVGDNAYMFKKYGRLPKDWQSFIKKGFDECWRVLKVNGTLVFKWNEVQIPTEKIIEAIGRKPLYGHKCGRQNKTHWMIFFKEAK